MKDCVTLCLFQLTSFIRICLIILHRPVYKFLKTITYINFCNKNKTQQKNLFARVNVEGSAYLIFLTTAIIRRA